MKKPLKLLLIIAICAALIALCALLIPAVLSLSEPENQKRFAEFIESVGFWGVLAMLFVQVLQIVVAVIPGEPIELLMGLMFGTWCGLFLTLAGILIGTTIVFFLVKRFGEPLTSKFVNVHKFDQLKFLHDPARRDSLIFILFLIPGTPKDVLTYFVPFTNIKFSHFLPLATLARIPSVISSTLVGAAVGSGKLWQSAIIFAATALIGLAGIFINSRLTKRLSDNQQNQGNLSK